MIHEFRDVVARKFASYRDAAKVFLSDIRYEILPVGASQVAISDGKDKPVLELRQVL